MCNIATDRPIPFDPYDENRDTGGFVLIDRVTHETVGAGMIAFALRRATNVVWQPLEVDRAARSRLNGHRPAVLWFTGLSGSGKSSVASRVEARLNAAGVHTFLIDGDNVRHGLNRDLGFTDADRVENIRRVAEVARLMTDAGLVVLVSADLPLPPGPTDGQGTDGRGRVPRDLRRHPPGGLRGARPEGALTAEPGPARSPTSPASRPPTSRRRQRSCGWTAPPRHPTPWPMR